MHKLRVNYPKNSVCSYSKLMSTAFLKCLFTMFGYIVPGVVADQHEVIAIEQSRCQVFIRQQMSLRGRRDEIPKFFDNPVMSGRRGGYLSYNACGTVSRFQQCPCVVEQEEVFFGADDDQCIGSLHKIAVDEHTDVAIAAGDKHLGLVFQQCSGIKPGFGSFEAFEKRL